MVPRHRLLVAAGLTSLFCANPSVAAEWSLASNVSQRVEADSNFTLEESSPGFVVGSTTRLNLRLGATTETNQWTFGIGSRITGFTGPGAESQLSGAYPRARAGFVHNGKRVTLGADLRFLREPAAFSQFGLELPPGGAVVLPDDTVLLPDDTVVPLEDFETITDSNATRTLARLRSGLRIKTDPRNSLAVAMSSVVERFSGDEGELVDSTSLSPIVAWDHDITRRTKSRLAFGYEYYAADDIENIESHNFTAKGGFETALTSRLDFGLDAGFTVADISRDLPGRDETLSGFAGGLKLDWRSADTNLIFLANHGFEPSSVGEIQQRSSLRFLFQHAVNSRSDISLLASYYRQKSVGSEDDSTSQLFALNPNYSIDLTPDWRLRLGYVFRLRDQSSGLADSSNVFIEIHRAIEFLK